MAWLSGKGSDLSPRRPGFDPLSSKALFSEKLVFDYVVNVQLTSSLRISEQENSQIQELTPCDLQIKQLKIFGSHH